jgi:hypothetical protein
VSCSGSRTAVAERSGAKSQLTAVTGAAVIIVMIVLVPGLFRNLPQPALAAVVITASLSLADILGTVRLWRQRKAECLLSIAAFLASSCSACCPGSPSRWGVAVVGLNAIGQMFFIPAYPFWSLVIIAVDVVGPVGTVRVRKPREPKGGSVVTNRKSARNVQRTADRIIADR